MESSYDKIVQAENINEIPKSNMIRVTYLFGENVQEEGVFARLQFQAHSDAESGQQ